MNHCGATRMLCPTQNPFPLPVNKNGNQSQYFHCTNLSVVVCFVLQSTLLPKETTIMIFWILDFLNYFIGYYLQTPHYCCTTGPSDNNKYLNLL